MVDIVAVYNIKSNLHENKAGLYKKSHVIWTFTDTTQSLNFKLKVFF